MSDESQATQEMTPPSSFPVTQQEIVIIEEESKEIPSCSPPLQNVEVVEPQIVPLPKSKQGKKRKILSLPTNSKQKESKVLSPKPRAIPPLIASPELDLSEESQSQDRSRKFGDATQIQNTTQETQRELSRVVIDDHAKSSSEVSSGPQKDLDLDQNREPKKKRKRKSAAGESTPIAEPPVTSTSQPNQLLRHSFSRPTSLGLPRSESYAKTLFETVPLVDEDTPLSVKAALLALMGRY